ncbi:cupin domain-containing protein [Streptococcus cameli]
MKKTAMDWIESLEMEAHIEGGYFKEVYRDGDNLEQRPLYSSIYFLLDEGNPSHFHRLTADEIWYFHDGQPLTIHMIHPDGRYEEVDLGLHFQKGQVLQYCVPKGTIFGSSVKKGFSMVSCMVSPAFEYSDFELFERSLLLEKYPEHTEIITKLTRV